jgi:16S rRNA (cytosine1402-N4)-methyltransferase
MVNRRVITPSADEVRLNPRSRSAKLRIAERLSGQGRQTQSINWTIDRHSKN